MGVSRSQKKFLAAFGGNFNISSTYFDFKFFFVQEALLHSNEEKIHNSTGFNFSFKLVAFSKMNSMDPSNVHSQGWELIDQNKIPKKLIIPNFDAPPPTVEECKKFIPNIERVEKFYADGEIRQQYYVKAVDDEKKKFLDQKKRIEEQLSSLNRFPVDLTRRM